MSRPGVLPAQALRALVEAGAISGEPPILADQVQPASLDLRLGRRAWRVRAGFLPGRKRTVAERLADFAMHEIDLDGGAAFETGCVYVAPLAERVRLPADVAGFANAKSSIGRIDLFTRVITDHGVEFDRAPPGYDGPLWAEISPRTFSVLARPGARLTQLRLRRGEARFTDRQLDFIHRSLGLVEGAALIDGGLGFSVDLSGAPGGPIAWRARPHSGLIDLDRLEHYAPLDFWDPIERPTHGGVILDPGAFYILVSRESVHVPPDCAAEMTPYMAVAGEFRVHYAGFFDPGFGHAASGGAGSRAVLEVRCHESPFALEHGQVVGRLVYEPMADTPDILYGEEIGSTYQRQGLRLSKHFRGT
jgi:dCTP deaminase